MWSWDRWIGASCDAVRQGGWQWRHPLRRVVRGRERSVGPGHEDVAQAVDARMAVITIGDSGFDVMGMIARMPLGIIERDRRRILGEWQQQSEGSDQQDADQPCRDIAKLAVQTVGSLHPGFAPGTASPRGPLLQEGQPTMISQHIGL